MINAALSTFREVKTQFTGCLHTMCTLKRITLTIFWRCVTFTCFMNSKIAMKILIKKVVLEEIYCIIS